MHGCDAPGLGGRATYCGVPMGLIVQNHLKRNAIAGNRRRVSVARVSPRSAHWGDSRASVSERGPDRIVGAETHALPNGRATVTVAPLWVVAPLPGGEDVMADGRASALMGVATVARVSASAWSLVVSPEQLIALSHRNVFDRLGHVLLRP